MTAEADRILGRLRTLAEEREDLAAREAEVYGEIVDLWEDGVAAGLSHAQLAAPAQVGKGTVTQALRKRRLG